MKIKSVAAYSKNLRLSRPYTIARETISTVENVFFEIELTNGITGIGAANPSPEVVGESTYETLSNLQSPFIQSLIGKDIRQFFKIIFECRKHFSSSPGTQAAIDIALHDAFCKILKIPVVNFYGQKHFKMLTSVTIGIKSVTETLKDAQEYFEKGFRILKIKTGNNAEEDAERILKILELYKNYFALRVDANEGYNIKELKKFLTKTAKANIELIEQPLPRMNDSKLQTLPKKICSKLVADESLTDEQSALKLIKERAKYNVFNIKLMKCGGIVPAMNIAAIARYPEIKLFWGCNDESIVGISAAVHAAFACEHTFYLDLDGHLDIAEDIATGGVQLKDGFLFLNNKPGLGIKKK